MTPTASDLSYLSFVVDQAGDTCWRLTSAQYFVSKTDAEEALSALSGLVTGTGDKNQPQLEMGSSGD